MGYAHLTEDERYTIYEMRKEHHTLEEIAQALGRHKSTISRELRRNRGERGYRPRQAHALSQARRACNGRRLAASVWAFARRKLKADWSPEQIAGRARCSGQGRISHETIYQRVYADKRAGGTLWRHLRCQKKRRKRYGSGRERRGQIPGRVSIEARPMVVERKARVGDWEGDTMIGAGRSAALVTLAERKTQYLALGKVHRKTAAAVAERAIAGLRPLKALVHTLTFDNGSEFAAHQRIARALDTAIYFAHPYRSWERGLNEQVNGLIRQYFPKKSCFAKITAAKLRQVMERLNNRPRKSLGYRTPKEMLLAAARRKGVALRI